MVDFVNDADVTHWLRSQPREVAVVMAARAALRVLPLIESGPRSYTAQPRATVILSCFRAATTAWVIGRFPTYNMALKAAAHAARADANRADDDAAAAATAAARAAGVGVDVTAAEAAVRAINAAVRAAVTNPAVIIASVNAVVTSIYRATAVDAVFIENAGNVADRPRLAITLAERPLWSDGTPDWVKATWDQMRAALLTTREGWDVWIALYDALLAGNAPTDPDIALAYVMPANDLWNNHPQDVNSEIKRLLTEAQKSLELPDEAALPHQSWRAAIFTEAEGGVIGIAPPTPQDRLANIPDVLDFYEEVREQAQYLAALGPNMLGQRLHQVVAKFQQCLPGLIEEAIERRVWSRGNALRVMLNEHDATASDLTHPHRLEPSAAETLRGLVQLFNQLTFADPSLRSRDARRPGPQEVDRASAGLKIAVEIIPVAAANRAITNSEAGAELSEQIDIAQLLDTVADDGLPSKLGKDHAAETVGNFISYAILRLRNAAVTKEIASGVYRQAGATIFVSASVLAQHISPAIASWFIASSDQLLAFGATFFEHVPAFRETVEWLREHIINDGQSQ